MLRIIAAAAAFATLAAGPALAVIEGPSTPTTVKQTEGDTPEAYVTDVKWIESETIGAKIYSTAGGDPAINGLYTYLAVSSEEPGGGWRVFQIGDFNSWEIAGSTDAHVDLKISRSWVEQASGEIKTIEETLRVAFPAADATEVKVAPVK